MKTTTPTLTIAAFLAASAAALSFASAAPVMPAAATAPAAPTPTVITVYEQPNFKGRALVFDKGVPSLAALDFNDRVASVTIKGSRDWVLCEHRNFMGRCVRVHAKAKSLKQLKMEGQVSSLYPVPPPAPKRPR